MSAMSTSRIVALATCTALALGLLGCTDSRPTPDEGASAPPRQKRASPFTGRPAGPRPVLAVKVDNVGPARPHTGLGAADLVYVEQVEAGQSRILAVFSSRLPAEVGPVRSARESDIALLRQFGRPALAYSGAQSRLKPALSAAPFVAVPPERSVRSYVRRAARPAPHNLYLRPRRLLADTSGVSASSDIGFRFGAPPPGGKPTAERTVRFPAARFTFRWSAERRAWLVALDRRAARTTDGGRVSAATVVIQRTTVRPSGYRDQWGSISPYTETVGSGTAVVLRDGKAHAARWKREAARGGTTFTTPSGDRLPFARGTVWVLFTTR